jgi:hypothetical protein
MIFHLGNGLLARVCKGRTLEPRRHQGQPPQLDAIVPLRAAVSLYFAISALFFLKLAPNF